MCHPPSPPPPVVRDTTRPGTLPVTASTLEKELNTLQRLGAAGKLGEAELTGTTFT